jgi:sugar phosphate isomerase/epimerase
LRRSWRQLSDNVRELYIGLLKDAVAAGQLEAPDPEQAVDFRFSGREGLKLRAQCEPHLCSPASERSIVASLQKRLGFPTAQARAPGQIQPQASRRTPAPAHGRPAGRSAATRAVGRPSPFSASLHTSRYGSHRSMKAHHLIAGHCPACSVARVPPTASPPTALDGGTAIPSPFARPTPRRRFWHEVAALGVCPGLISAVAAAAASPRSTAETKTPTPKPNAAMRIGFHTDAFNSAYWSFDKCLEWAQKNHVHSIECGLIDGVSWIHGLGYQPHVALYEDPALLRRKMDKYGVQFSQVDAAYPLSQEDGPLRGVPYVMKSIAWAAQIGCPCVDTTDGLHAPEGLQDPEAMAMMKRSYQQILRVAEAHKVIVNIEPHGYFTTNPDRMAEMLAFSESPYLRMNLDTGNTFIAGQDPAKFLQRFLKSVSHVHLKDVSESLAKALRGGMTGIAVSHCSLGEGVNAENIKQCLGLLRDHGYTGTLSMECEGGSGPMIEKSLAWLRATLKELGIQEAR